MLYAKDDRTRSAAQGAILSLLKGMPALILQVCGSSHTWILFTFINILRHPG
jgi:hypothetical protein